MLLTRRNFLSAACMAAVSTRPLIASTWRQSTFAPKIGLTRGPEHAKKLAAMGAQFIEVGCGHFMPDKSEDDYAARRKELKECGLPIHGANGFLPGRLKSTGPNADHKAIADYASVIFRRGEEVGLQTVTFGSSGSRSLPEGFPQADAELQFVALLSRLAPLAARHGIRVCVEPLQKSETNFIQYVKEANRLVEAVQQPNVGITADIFHMMRGGESAESIRIAAKHIQHVHLAELAKRTAPGVDGDDFTPYLQVLKDVGYAGPISMECRWDDLEQQFPVALETLQTQLGGLK